jgi:hypothetical protein
MMRTKNLTNHSQNSTLLLQGQKAPISSELQQEACMEVEYRNQKQLLTSEVSPQPRLTASACHKLSTSIKW